jgi:Phytanoyl-CoA dioxygenase (PhyH)
MTPDSTRVACDRNRLQGPVAKLAALKSQCTGSAFNREIYAQTGVYVVTGAFPTDAVGPWLSSWSDFYRTRLTERQVYRFNPVAVTEEPPEDLKAIYRDSRLLDIAEQIFGADIALYNFRILIKDKHSRGPIFRHHDLCYHMGYMNRASFFVPLSRANRGNGALSFILGTHHFGYLGDAGELLDAVLDPDWPILSPELSPGDLVVMHSALWHESGPHSQGEDRVMADICLQPASDPSGIEILRGEATSEYRIPEALRGKVFKRSRVSRLAELQSQVDALAKPQ